MELGALDLGLDISSCIHPYLQSPCAARFFAMKIVVYQPYWAGAFAYDRSYTLMRTSSDRGLRVDKSATWTPRRLAAERIFLSRACRDPISLP